MEKLRYKIQGGKHTHARTHAHTRSVCVYHTTFYMVLALKPFLSCPAILFNMDAINAPGGLW